MKRRFLHNPEAPWWRRWFGRDAVTDGVVRWQLSEDADHNQVMILEPDTVIRRIAAEWPERAAYIDRSRRQLMEAILNDPRKSTKLAGDRRDLYVASGICPACAYDLLALPLCTSVVVCPECGRGWVIPQLATL